MFDDFLRIIAFIGVAAFMSSVAGSLQQIARDLRILAGRHEAKPSAGDPERLLDA